MEVWCWLLVLLLADTADTCTMANNENVKMSQHEQKSSVRRQDDPYTFVQGACTSTFEKLHSKPDPIFRNFLVHPPQHISPPFRIETP